MTKDNSEWLIRWRDASLPWQTWKPFPDEAVVLIQNAYGEEKIGPVSKFWWGCETEMGEIGEGVIIRVRRLDKPKKV